MDPVTTLSRSYLDTTIVDGRPVGPDKTVGLALFELIGTTMEQQADDIASLQGAVAFVGVTAATWVKLAAITGTYVGQAATVAKSDSGTHTDPVVGGVVNNAGGYSWSASPAGWQRVSDLPVSGYASQSDVVALQSTVATKANQSDVTALQSAVAGKANASDLTAATATVGELMPRVNFTYGFSNGATGVVTAGRVVGMTIPSGSTGNLSYVTPGIPFTADQVAALTGRTVEFDVVLSATANFLSTFGFTASAVEVPQGSGVIAGSVISTVQAGTVITRKVQYTFTGTETEIGVSLQIGTTAISASSAQFIVSSVTWRVVASAALDAPTAAGTTIAQAVRLQASQPFAAGDLFASLSTNNTYALQAVARTGRDGRPLGWTIPVGGYGGASVLQYILPLPVDDQELLVGRTVKLTLGFDCNPEYARGVTPTFFAQNASGFMAMSDVRIARNWKPTNARQVIEMSGVVPTGAVTLAPTIANGADGTTAQTDWLILTDFRLEIISTPSDTLTAADETALLTQRVAERRSIAIASGAKAGGYWGNKLVALSGGDYTTVTAAIAALTYASVNRRIEIQIAASTIVDGAIVLPDYVDLRGAIRHLSTIQYAQAASASLSAISTNSAIEANRTSRLANLTITAQNARYAVHADSFKSDPNGFFEIVDCVVMHLGNAAARAYQTSISGNPGGVWSNECALGFGSSSGLEQRFTRTRFVGGPVGNCAMGHNNTGQTSPWRVWFEDCGLIALDSSGAALRIGSAGSRQSDTCTLIGNQYTGPIMYDLTGWLSTAAADQVANKIEVTLRGHSNSPTPFVMLDAGWRALRIDSATTGTSSSVTVSGTAATALFGSTVPVAGDVGLAGGTYGTWDVSGVLVGPNADQAITSMGYRLGDCSSVSKALVVTIDGGAPITITFNTNLTAVSNATILATINTALSTHGTASLFNVNDLYRPHFLDEETTLINAGSSTILRKSVVRYGMTRQSGQTMVSTDPAYTFAGIALEDIRPGQAGRVKIRGQLRLAQDILRSDSGAFAAGQAFGVGATAGQIVANPTIPLFAAVNTTDIDLTAMLPAASERAQIGAAASGANTDLTSIGGLTTPLSVSQGGTGAATTAAARTALALDGYTGRNRLRNPTFSINQRVVSGAVTLAAGIYGHDGVKGGASGCTYTFATSGTDTTLTISAGSLIMPIETSMIEGGVYTASHAGTAQMRVWQGTGSTGSGSYATGPVTTAALTAATQTNLEFSTGTVLRPQFEPGSSATAFERRLLSAELQYCQRYYEKSYTLANPPGYSYPGSFQSVQDSPVAFAYAPFSFGARKRAAPTITLYDKAGGSGTITYWNGSGWSSGLAVNQVITTEAGFSVQLGNTGYSAYQLDWTAAAEI